MNYPRDIIIHHIIRWYPRDWLYVSRDLSRVSSENILLDPRVSSKDLNSIFNLMIYKNNLKLIKKLLLYPDVDASNSDNYPIKYASRNAEIVQLLLADQRVDPTVGKNYLIRNAAQNGHISIIKLLLNDSRICKNIVLKYVVKYNHLSIVKMILTNNFFNINPSMDDNILIILASQNGSVDMMKILLKDPRVDPSACENTAIIHASEKGNVEVVKLLLLDPRVNPSAGENDALVGAIFGKHMELFKLLLSDPRINLIPRGYLIVGEIIKMGESNDIIEIFQHLLANKIFNNGSITFYLYDALITAINCKNIKIAKLLLAEPHMDPCHCNNNPIICASEKGLVEIVKILLADPRVNPCARNNKALHLATEHGHTSVVELLLLHPKRKN